VLTVTFEKQSESNATWALSPRMPFVPHVNAGAGGFFAPYMRQYMERYGAPDHIGCMVAVKDRLNACRNPYAHLQIPNIDLAMVQQSPMLWEPLRFLESCPSSDGACALVIADEELARAFAEPAGVDRRQFDACRRHHVRRQGQYAPAVADRLRKGRVLEGGNHASAQARSTWPSFMCRSAGTSRCTSRRWVSVRRARAGNSPRRARPRWTGDIPINPSGGVLSSNPIGASGHAAFRRSGALQVRGMAGEHQVDGARLAVGHAFGGAHSYYAMWVVSADRP
jgi:acetyl-CoA C-acetyltransferase